MAEQSSPLQPGFLRMPKLPVSGFFIRLFAFLLDLFLLLSLIHLLARFASGILWELGQWAPYLSAGITFLYFALLNGPVGRGRTLGKFLLRVQVTDYDGNSPTFRQAVIRTVVLIPLYVSVPLTEAFIGPSTSAMSDYVKMLLTTAPFIAVLVATALTIPFNPFKQGLHDFLAKTLVRPAANGEKILPTFEEMTAQVGYSWPKFHRQPQYSGGVTFAIIFALLAFSAFPGKRAVEMKEYESAYYSLKQVPGFLEPSALAVPYTDQRLQEIPLYEQLKQAHLLTQDDTPTTGTTNLYVTVIMPGKWAQAPDSEDFEPYVEQFSDTYLRSVLPLIVKNVQNVPKADWPSWYSDQWRTDSLRLNVIFLESIGLYPYPTPLVRIKGKFVKTYPSLESGNSQSQEEISLDKAELEDSN